MDLRVMDNLVDPVAVQVINLSPWVLELQTKDILVVLHDLLHMLVVVAVVLDKQVKMLQHRNMVVLVVTVLELLLLVPHIPLELMDLDQRLVDG